MATLENALLSSDLPVRTAWQFIPSHEDATAGTAVTVQRNTDGFKIFTRYIPANSAGPDTASGFPIYRKYAADVETYLFNAIGAYDNSGLRPSIAWKPAVRSAHPATATGGPAFPKPAPQESRLDNLAAQLQATDSELAAVRNLASDYKQRAEILGQAFADLFEVIYSNLPVEIGSGLATAYIDAEDMQEIRAEMHHAREVMLSHGLIESGLCEIEAPETEEPAIPADIDQATTPQETAGTGPGYEIGKALGQIIGLAAIAALVKGIMPAPSEDRIADYLKTNFDSSKPPVPFPVPAADSLAAYIRNAENANRAASTRSVRIPITNDTRDMTLADLMDRARKFTGTEANHGKL
jgi:hypothetical protein